jgi:predicted nucleic acid-binding protein
VIRRDTSVLFVALETSRPGHELARRSLEAHADDAEFARCELGLLELYVLVRRPATAPRSLDVASAVRLIQQFRGNPRCDASALSGRHWPVGRGWRAC